MMVSPEREIECARLVVEMQHYFVGLLEERRTQPRDDLLTAVVRAADDPKLHFDVREQLTVLSIDLLASGNETTTAAITSGLKLLIDDPAAMREVRGDRNCCAILRKRSPARVTGAGNVPARDTRRDARWRRAARRRAAQRAFRRREPGRAQFPAAERIDLHRSQPGKHLALGIGRHHCIGAQLARQEIISALTGLARTLRSFGSSRAAAAGVPAEFFWTQPAAVLVTLTPRRAPAICAARCAPITRLPA